MDLYCLNILSNTVIIVNDKIQTLNFKIISMNVSDVSFELFLIETLVVLLFCCSNLFNFSILLINSALVYFSKFILFHYF
jgi:hypothetical protein